MVFVSSLICYDWIASSSSIAPLQVGDCVTAFSRASGRLHRGQILMIQQPLLGGHAGVVPDPEVLASTFYRIQYEQSSVPDEWVQDTSLCVHGDGPSPAHQSPPTVKRSLEQQWMNEDAASPMKRRRGPMAPDQAVVGNGEGLLLQPQTVEKWLFSLVDHAVDTGETSAKGWTHALMTLLTTTQP